MTKPPHIEAEMGVSSRVFSHPIRRTIEVQDVVVKEKQTLS
jgi:hypothetical protein